MSKYQVTCIVLTYNPDYKKLESTIKSLIYQEDINIEIIVTDDGSANFSIENIKNLFLKYDFNNYKINANQNNGGIVKNLYSSMNLVEGECVKTISPGDYLYDRNTLKKMYNHFIKNGYAAMGSDYNCYHYENGEMVFTKEKIFPRVKNINQNKLPYHYIVLLKNNYCGATIMYEAQKLKDYLNLIVGKVIHLEDSIIRIMCFNGEKIGFFDEITIMYEHSSGISTTSNGNWWKIILNDSKQADDVMFEQSETAQNKTIKKKYLLVKRMNNEKNLLKKVIALLTVNGYLTSLLLSIKFYRKSTLLYDKEWVDFIHEYKN